MRQVRTKQFSLFYVGGNFEIVKYALWPPGTMSVGRNCLLCNVHCKEFPSFPMKTQSEKKGRKD